MGQTTKTIRWTVRDLEVLPQSEGTSYELIDGELLVTRSPLWLSDFSRFNPPLTILFL